MTQTLAAGPLIAARYELLRPLRSGPDASFAPLLVRDTISGGEVVLKQVDADVVGARAELRDALAAVGDTALLLPRQAVVDGATVYEVLDYLPGGEIGRLRGRPWSFVVRRLLPVIEALGRLHAAGIVHGDIKSSNVLLDADGLARLADFGSTQRLETAARAPGSPYAMSPERHAGGPVSIADDVYAVGALLYELISGHPPFYPDLTPERVRDESPAPLAGNPPPPAELAALVAQCLAKDPEQRPASAHEIATQLAGMLERSATADAAVPGGAPRLQPPPDALPLQAKWQRAGQSGPTAAQSRREGFRRGLLASAVVLAIAAVGFTFFVLPDLVAQRSPVAVPQPPSSKAPPASAKDDVTHPPNLEQLAELKRRADEMRAPLPERMRKLEQTDAARWGTADLATAKAKLAAGDASMEQREFTAAIDAFTTVGATLAALEKRRPDVLKGLLKDAAVAFDAGRAAEAAGQFAAALRVDPANATARAGLARSKVLDDVMRETSLGARAEQQGDTGAAAAAYKRALGLDPASKGAREGLARLQARATGDAFAANMAQALAALAHKEYPAAQAAFQRADKIRPGTAEVADGLRQLRLATETQNLAQTMARGRAAEQEERWADAVAIYREALKADSALREAQEGLERSEPRAMLGAQLQAFIDRPERLYSQAGREAARSALGQVSSVASRGPRLQEQVTRVTELLHQAETPVHVALASDNVTDVQVYRVGKLGPFASRELELMPGRYTVVGTREGYRDVRKEIMLLPGSAPPVVTIRCEEPI